MIAKGTTHNNGAKLARYITTGKDNERAELWQLAGFAANDIRDAFRSVHVMAQATRCEQPFFHVQVRNPEGEQLSRAEWGHVANRIETKLGLTGQPRAIAFHIDEKTGHEHMHVAWSRIDGDTLTARPLPFFKDRLKEVCRELEKDMGLIRVKNERDDQLKAPTRNEFEQARRLGVDVNEMRQTIRECWDHSDNGRSFRSALVEHDAVLARGDKRDFVVIDPGGGLHALGKRILNASASKVRDRLADLQRDKLPSIEQARDNLQRTVREREGQKPQKMPDPYREEIKWQDALAKAAIEKEKTERKFVERKAEEKRPGGREKEQGAKPPDHLRGVTKEIWTAYNSSSNVNEFVQVLANGVELASVTRDEADRSHREATFAKAINRFAPTYREGEIVVVTEPGNLYRRDGQIVEPRRVFQLNKYTTGQDRDSVTKFLAPLDRDRLQGIEATKEKLSIRAAARAERWADLRSDHAQSKRADERTTGKESRMPAAFGRNGERALSQTLDGVVKTFESLFAPVLTPQQKREGARRQEERAADAADGNERVQNIAELELERQRSEREEMTRRRERGGRER